uniref:Uncharacterized protein n=1 Tax=Anguilla anguilla TaxID=7936 RepID=A0A0E9UMY2_ANGAN
MRSRFIRPREGTYHPFPAAPVRSSVPY